MSNHRDRMAALARIAMPPQGTAQREQFENLIRDNPERGLDRASKKLFEAAWFNLQAQLRNGTALVGSETLRDFLAEFNNRVHAHDIHTLPVSFSILEAFCTYEPMANTFFLIPEEEHACTLADFLDFYTSRTPPNIALGVASMRRNTIYTFEFIDPPHFHLTGGEGTYLIRAASLVLRGSEISLCLVGGELVDPEAEADMAKQAVLGDLPSWKASLASSLERQMTPALLDGTNSFLRVLFLCRFESRSNTRETAVYMRDMTTSYVVTSDNAETYLDPVSGKPIATSELAEEMKQRIQSMSTLSEIAGVLLFLPWFFESHAENCEIENHPTRLRESWPKWAIKNKTGLIAPEYRVFARPVKVFPVQQDSESVLAVCPPDLRIESSGYWRRLEPWLQGEDRDGRAITGRTWVKKQLEWVERVASGGLHASKQNPRVEGPDPGILYVMRSAAHPENVFKVGLTRRSVIDRARELGGATGMPDGMLPVFKFDVGDCARLEKAVHEALAGRRLRRNREFFQIDLPALYAAIIRVLHDNGEQY